MGISSALGVGAIQPGVVADSSQRPASPYEGQLIFQRDTNALYLYDGSAWVMVIDTDQAPGLQLIKTQTIGSAVASVTVNDVFSSSFETYRIEMYGCQGSANSDIQFALGSSNSLYYGSYYYDLYTGANTGTTRINNGTLFYVGGIAQNKEQSTRFDIFNPHATERTSWHGQAYGNGYSFWYAGTHAGATSFTGFTVSAISGTLTGGTIRVYGYRNS